MKFTNEEIYYYGYGFDTFFSDFNEYMPAALSFYFLKNKKAIINSYVDVIKIRKEILKRYADNFNEQTGDYHISNENVIIANQELSDLFAIEQNIEIHKIPLSDFEGIRFTPNQMETIMYMIKEETEHGESNTDASTDFGSINDD